MNYSFAQWQQQPKVHECPMMAVVPAARKIKLCPSQAPIHLAVPLPAPRRGLSFKRVSWVAPSSCVHTPTRTRTRAHTGLALCSGESNKQVPRASIWNCEVCLRVRACVLVCGKAQEKRTGAPSTEYTPRATRALNLFTTTLSQSGAAGRCGRICCLGTGFQ